MPSLDLSKLPIERPMAGGFGKKALALMTLCAMASDHDVRHPAYLLACNEFSPRSVALKLTELADRGYIAKGSRPWLATLTDRGRQALESQPMRA